MGARQLKLTFEFWPTSKVSLKRKSDAYLNWNLDSGRQARNHKVMKSKVLISLAAALTITAASAQTQVGQVTLTPVQAPVQSRPSGVKPRPTSTAPSTKATTAKTSTFQTQQVPAGWYNLTGQVGGINASLPKGSQVVLSLEEVGNPSNHLLQVKFGASRLPVPYQMYFNSSRLQASKAYGVRAKVYGAEGQLLYTSATTLLPKGNAGTLNLQVKSQ